MRIHRAFKSLRRAIERQRFRLRLSVRQLTFGVLLAALVLSFSVAAMRSGRLAAEYRARAAYLAHFEHLASASEVDIERERLAALQKEDRGEADRLAGFVTQARETQAWYSRKRRLYEHAATRPWESLPAELRRRPFPHREPGRLDGK